MSSEVSIAEVPIGQSRLTFTYRRIMVEVYSLIPRLRLDFDVHYALGPGQPGYNIILSFGKSELKIITKAGENLYAGMLVPEQPTFTLLPNSSFSTRLFADFDHYRLSQVEKIREGGDLQARIELFFIAELQQQPSVKYPATTSFNIRIPKSDWVEKILPDLKYKEVSLIEIPKIEKPEFSDTIIKINEAWKMYSMGEYDKVLAECRKALESLIAIIKNKGFSKEIEEEGKKKTVPDWEKALGHKEMSNIMEVFVQKLFGFLSRGSHYGKPINREDAEFAIMTTHALVNFVEKKVGVT